MKLQPGIKSICMVPGTTMCQELQTWPSHINGSIKTTSKQSPRLWSWQLKSRPSTPGQWHTRSTTLQDPKCRLCKQHVESVAHITSGCSKLAGSKYTSGHNNVASTVYRALCAESNLEHSEDWWVKPEKVVKNDHAKILWNSHLDWQAFASQLA